jgi:hypothetical protein
LGYSSGRPSTFWWKFILDKFFKALFWILELKSAFDFEIISLDLHAEQMVHDSHHAIGLVLPWRYYVVAQR